MKRDSISVLGLHLSQGCSQVCKDLEFGKANPNIAE